MTERETRRKFQILVIDDDEFVRDALQVMLEHAGHAILEAANGREAMAIWQHHWPDLIITDLIMPDMEGIETIREIRKAAPDSKIIAISGGGRIQGKDLLKLAGDLGANAIFTKPVDRDQFLAGVHSLLASA